ncbi:type II secretion system protein [Vibrio crassostreae]|uniref:type II secretion system protein n=1 Tax=Vibrio crassostreae TaxID=246167 RepID=UPI0010462FEE|nr:type II secretion system protein [Vibrio crassostreae]
MKKNGFTLMELIIVIVILGVLAVTAAPRFLNIQESAREAVLEGVAGAMEGVITQVTSKAIIAGLDPDATNPGDQSNYVIDFGIGSVEVDWGTLCPESQGESGDKPLKMLDFLTLSEDESLTSDFGNRHTVVGYDYDFSQAELDSTNITDADLETRQGCFVLYDSFGRTNGSQCPDEGCECTVRIVNNNC